MKVSKYFPNKGFSLIELLVVVAIIATLAAFAVPAYKQYSIRAKIAALEPLLNAFGRQIQQYYVQNNVWPNAAQLNSANSGTTVASPGTYNTILSAITIGTQAVAGTGCGATSSYVQFVIPASNAGYGSTWPSAQANLTWTTQYFTVGNSNAFKSVCGYSAPNTSADAFYLPTVCQAVFAEPSCS